MQPKQGVGTWVHPLEENIERKALTAAERSKKLVRQAEQAEEVLREHAEVPPEPNTEEAAHGQEPDSQSDKDFSPNAGEKPKRGRPKQPDSEDRVAEYLGVPQQTVNLAKQHVAAMEKYPLLGKPRQIFRDIYGLLSRPYAEGRTRCRAYEIMRADRPFVEHRNGGQTVAPSQHLRAQGEPHMNGSSDPDFTGKRALA